MKFRTDFVTNSSSSGFISVRVSSETLSRLFDEAGVSLEQIVDELDSISCEGGGFPYAITDSVARTICVLLESYKNYRNEIDDEIIELLCKKIVEQCDEIDAEADADIDSLDVASDSGAPDFYYSRLYMNKGKGELEEIKVCRSGRYIDDNNMSEFDKWVKDNGYCDSDGRYDNDFYWDPPIYKMLESYSDVKRTIIDFKPSKDE